MVRHSSPWADPLSQAGAAALPEDALRDPSALEGVDGLLGQGLAS